MRAVSDAEARLRTGGCAREAIANGCRLDTQCLTAYTDVLTQALWERPRGRA